MAEEHIPFCKIANTSEKMKHDRIWWKKWRGSKKMKRKQWKEEFELKFFFCFKIRGCYEEEDFRSSEKLFFQTNRGRWRRSNEPYQLSLNQILTCGHIHKSCSKKLIPIWPKTTITYNEACTPNHGWTIGPIYLNRLSQFALEKVWQAVKRHCLWCLIDGEQEIARWQHVIISFK